MNRSVRELPKAKQDKHSIFRWLYERSPSGAASWLRAYDLLVEQLGRDASSFGEALENKGCDFDVRQALFKTARGRVYLALFFIEDDVVYILRIRGPGQGPISPAEMT
jgi:plasmid stabilization system protein ParE